MDGDITVNSPNIPAPTGGTTRSYGNMLNQKTDTKKKRKFSPWEKVGK